MSSAQQYCLRWNNHRSNLLRVFDELLQNEAFTDVTIVCDGGDQLKCHKMVLAACSPYFQNLFTNLPCKHPVVVLKDVRYFEMKAILEYMYRGEVNVAQNQLAALLKVAEALKVKGLVEENRPPTGSHSDHSSYKDDEKMNVCSPPGMTMQNIVHSSSSNHNSPPHTTNSMYKNPYTSLYSSKSSGHQDRMSGLNLWAVPNIPIQSPLPQHSSSSIPSPNNHHQHHHSTAASSTPTTSMNYESSSSEVYPHRRKKFSSMMMNKDTPILRTVLGQGQADSSQQPVSLVCHADSREQDSNSSEPERLKKHMKNEPLEDAQSPYTNFSVMSDDDVKPKMGLPSSSPQSYSSTEVRSVKSGIAGYVPAQRPEWKRYKQYSREDIMAAIDAVRNGMSALQAAKKYTVPSRTLYDKVKKMGITTSRPFKRGSNGSTSCFSYMLSSTTGSPYNMSENDDQPMNNNTALLEASNFLQHALDGRGGGPEDALSAMAAAAAAHAAASHSTSPSNHGLASSPSPSPTLLKYMQHNNMTPSPSPNESDNHLSETNGSSEREHDYDDEVEDLSIGSRKNQQQESGTGVIVPGPMSNQVSTIMKKDDVLMMKQDLERINIDSESMKQSQPQSLSPPPSRREMSIDEAAT